MTTEAEDAAKAALQASMGINAAQVTMTEESRRMLAAMLREEMRVAVAEGIAAAMTDEAARKFALIFFGVAKTELRTQTKSTLGDWLLTGLGMLAGKIGWWLLFVAAVWWVGGPAAAWKALTGLAAKAAP